MDREVFSEKITRTWRSLENVEVVRKEVTALPRDGITVLATGPLTSEPLGRRDYRRSPGTPLFFYDAISPIVTRESDRFQKGLYGLPVWKGRGGLCQLPDERGRILSDSSRR